MVAAGFHDFFRDAVVEWTVWTLEGSALLLLQSLR